MNITETAWYLKTRREDVADRAVLVGDRSRVLRAAALLDDAVILNEDRGLTTTTGTFRGQRITVSAFGMGAPIAAVVLHELATLGVQRFLRLGTAMSVGAARLGDFVVAHGAVRGESTSSSYLPIEYPAVADFALTQRVTAAAIERGLPTRGGLFASYDGFYTEMFETGLGAEPVGERYERLARHGVIAIDMETSAILVAARALGVQAASLCLASVEGVSNRTLSREERLDAETELLLTGFDALS